MPSAVAEARRVLKPGGLLLDIHPNDEPNWLEVWRTQYALNADALPDNLAAITRLPVGELDHTAEAFYDFTAATDALAEALEQGFEWVNALTFEYRYFFDTLDELTHHLDEEWEDVSASEAVLERALMLLGQATTPTKLVAIQRVGVTGLVKSER